MFTKGQQVWVALDGLEIPRTRVRRGAVAEATIIDTTPDAVTVALRSTGRRRRRGGLTRVVVGTWRLMGARLDSPLVHALQAVPPEQVRTAIRDEIPRIGTGQDSYVCGHCAHVLATLGAGPPMLGDSVWMACPGCGWSVAIPTPLGFARRVNRPRPRVALRRA